MARAWSVEEISAITRMYQQSCVLAAAADLDLFDRLAGRGGFTAADAAAALGSDPRGTAVLLDALASMEILEKRDVRYSIPPSVADALTSAGAHSVLAMTQHQANCLRRWAELARVVKTGQPALRTASIRGEEADYAAFVEAMDNISRPMAETVLGQVALPPFQHLVDIGGASGTWTISFLRARPQATGTLFDLPHVIPMARRRLEEAGLGGRVKLVGGDFYADPIPPGADLAWLSAIVHQNSRQQNRELFAKIHSALKAGGHLLIRDIVMEESRTAPPSGAMFAVNMLVATQAGSTFTLNELREDLGSAGFADVRLLRRDGGMNSVAMARKSV